MTTKWTPEQMDNLIAQSMTICPQDYGDGDPNFIAEQDEIMAAVILEAVKPERYTADSLEEYRYQWAMGKIKTFPKIGELVEAAG